MFQDIHKNIKNKAFTLAEVLITLLIIGVIASLIIPAFLQDTQDAELRTAWKKTYSDINQSVSRMIMDNGGTLINLCIGVPLNNCFRYGLENYMVVTKDCIPGKSEGNCWRDWGSDLGGFIMSRGTLVKTEWNDNACNSAPWHGNLPKCAMIWVDVNGFRGPNLWGKDMYAIQVFQNGMKPIGVPGDGFTVCTPSTNGNLGFGCSAQYLYQ